MCIVPTREPASGLDGGASSEQNYRTRDLGQAAFLLTRRFALLRVEPDGSSRRLCFVFPPEATEAAADYFRGGTAEARGYFNNIRDLKSLLVRR